VNTSPDSDLDPEIVRASNAAIFSVDREGRIQTWNGGAESLFGFAAEEVLGADQMLIVPDDRKDEARGEHARASAGEAISLDTVRCDQSGREIEVAISLAPLRDRHGVIVGTCSVAQKSERRFLESAVLEAGDRENRRIGQALHDQLCQLLLGAAFSAKALANRMPALSTTASEVADLARLVNSAVQQVREVARGLNPPELDSASLVTALLELTQRPLHGVTCRLECEQPVLHFDAITALHFYRIAQEAVANAVAHSGGSEVIVRLSEDTENVVLEIHDNGRGFAPAMNRGLGLASMEYRARAIGARLSVDTRAVGGTSVICVLPRRP
jgi:PAS domain S-box-containing protein